MQTATNDERRLSKTEVEAESYVNESENPMDFGFAKKLSESDNIWFKLRHIRTTGGKLKTLVSVNTCMNNSSECEWAQGH